MSKNIEKMIAKTFSDIATGLETGSFGSRPRILLTGLGSEHGEEETLQGAVMGAVRGADVIYVGTKEHDAVTTVPAASDDEAHAIMEQMLANGEADGAVTMHYPFPIGVSTVGRAVTPGLGRPVYLATTTGTSAANRVEGMVKNAVYGIITAKACGIAVPTVGILNVDGARQAEMALKELQSGGYLIRFADSTRADGGCVMRGNDLLRGACDVMVTDPLTGNVLSKMLSSYTTGGSYESVGYGYGPGIGKDYDRLVMIVSRASGAPVIAGAIEYAAELVRGGWQQVARAEFEAAEKAGLNRILEKLRNKDKAESTGLAEIVQAPPKEIVTGEIGGIEITDLEDAVTALWKAGLYAESGMGCTGPVVLVNEQRLDEAMKLLADGGWVSAE